MQSKLNFLHYLLNQSDDSLAHQILMEQKKRGLVNECNKFIEDLKILDPFQLDVSSTECKRIVREAILTANQDELTQEIKEK